MEWKNVVVQQAHYQGGSSYLQAPCILRTQTMQNIETGKKLYVNRGAFSNFSQK